MAATNLSLALLLSWRPCGPHDQENTNRDNRTRGSLSVFLGLTLVVSRSWLSLTLCRDSEGLSLYFTGSGPQSEITRWASRGLGGL